MYGPVSPKAAQGFGNNNSKDLPTMPLPLTELRDNWHESVTLKSRQ